MIPCRADYEESAKLENYILSVGKKWVSPPYNVDGWRLDVAADLGRSRSIITSSGKNSGW